MTVREELERLEHRRLNPLATFADGSTGRPRQEPERVEDVRTCFQRDTDRVVHNPVCVGFSLAVSRYSMA